MLCLRGQEAPAARMLRAQQEVAAIKDRLKLLGAKLVKIEAANRRSNIKVRAEGRRRSLEPPSCMTQVDVCVGG